VASKITGRLIDLKVEEGDRVKKGEVIARLENEDAKASREQAAANLNVARFTLDQARAEMKDASLSFQRSRELLNKQYISSAENDSAEARYKKAVAAVAAAEAAVRAGNAALRGADVLLEYSYMRAPFDAVVLTKNADIGDIVTPLGAAANAKASVVTIADMDSLQVEADVSEANLGQVRVGQPCELQLDALPESRFSGKVHMIVPTADRTKATVLVKVGFVDKDRRILPEMSAKVAFLQREVKPEEQKPRAAVNPAAITEREGKRVAFLIKDGHVAETAVVTGIELGDMVEVVSGLKPGDKVVLRPLYKIKNGSGIKIVEK
jgi:RND family efflux transporter MFP subunit